MGEWHEIVFEKLAKVQGGFAFKSEDYTDEGNLLVRIGNLQNGRINKQNSVYIKGEFKTYEEFILKETDILIGLTGDLGKIAFVCNEDLPALLNQRVGRFVPKIEVDSNYIYHLISSQYFIEKLKVFFEGGAQANISPKQIEAVKVIVPKEKSEQTRIAEILSTADEAIAHTEALIAKYQRIKTGLMQDLLTRGIDENGNIRSKETHKFVVKNGIEVPEEWEVDNLGDLCKKGGGSIQTGPFGSQLHAEDYKEEGIPIITVEHLVDNRIAHENLPLVGEADYKRLKKYILNTGDLVFSRVGAIDRCSITTESENGWMFSGRCLRVRPGKLFNSHFLMCQLNFDLVRNYILSNAVGSTMKCLNTTILYETPVFLPKTIEQIQISEKIKSFENQLSQLNNRKNKLQSLKTGLMQDLLSGKVRVNMDNKN